MLLFNLIFLPTDSPLRHALSWQLSKSLPDLLPERSDSPAHPGPPIVRDGTEGGKRDHILSRGQARARSREVIARYPPDSFAKEERKQGHASGEALLPSRGAGGPRTPGPSREQGRPGCRAPPSVGRARSRPSVPQSEHLSAGSRTKQSRRDPWIWEPGLARTPRAARRPSSG